MFKNKGGRPKKELDHEEMEKLAALHCTQEEVAGWFGVSIDTVTARCKDWGYEGFPDFFKRHSAKGKVSLRRHQFEVAKKGNCGMLIWLGKQYLNQNDTVDLTDSNIQIKLAYNLEGDDDAATEERPAE